LKLDGHTEDPPPTQVDALTLAVCVNAGTVSAALTQIPNEPVVFYNDPKRETRSEDKMIGISEIITE
jgi:hypothetical protein